MVHIFSSPTLVSPFPPLSAPNFEIYEKTLTLNYPCKYQYECTSYSLSLHAGIYRIECYGAGAGREGKPTTTQRKTSGTECELSQETVQKYGGNTVCDVLNSGGSGGYISGIINLQKKTTIFANIGGSGIYLKDEKPKGGFNGGGDARYYYKGSSSGGGATDVRIEKNDFYHRIIVGGGGGGTDDTFSYGLNDEGSGGCGGYPNGQGYWMNGGYINWPIATQLDGFTFGYGESALIPKPQHPNASTGNGLNDLGGAGGGWFGGFVSRDSKAGAGGGSSFILTFNATIPKGDIIVHSPLYVEQSRQKYPFIERKDLYFDDIRFSNGIWSGNGLIKITNIFLFDAETINSIQPFSHSFFVAIINRILISGNI